MVLNCRQIYLIYTSIHAGTCRRVIRDGEAEDRYLGYHTALQTRRSALSLEHDALAAMEALKAQAAAAREAQAAADRTAMTEATEAEITYTANTTTNTSGPIKSGGTKKKAGKPKLSAKEKKERSVRRLA